MLEVRWPLGALSSQWPACWQLHWLLPPSVSCAAASRVGSWYLFGSNMPWLNWAADFGGGPNGGGVSSNLVVLDSRLRSAHDTGMHILRWWVFEGGSPQIQRDASGTPTGLNPSVDTDLDAALNEAAKYDISGKTDLGPQQSAAPPTATAEPPTATTVPPTATSVPPTATPVVPTPTAAPPAQPTWTLAARTSAGAVRRGGSIKVTARVTDSKSTTALVDIEIYDQNWNKVYQRFWDNQSFTANVTRSFGTTWNVPAGAATGTYTVMVGTFGPGWNGAYSWNDNAARFVVR
jgi:hypothetical protein